jgi:hypothetical protein
MTTRTKLGTLAICAFTAAVPAAAVAAARDDAPGKRTLTTKLTGAVEVPGPGDPDGRGGAVVKLDAATGTVCFKITAKDVAGTLAGHIHEAPAGAAGPVVVGLFMSPSTDPKRRGCVEGVDPALVREILADPSDYYVNVHNAEYPGGALRGQLG